jgi:hypothetical protein
MMASTHCRCQFGKYLGAFSSARARLPHRTPLLSGIPATGAELPVNDPARTGQAWAARTPVAMARATTWAATASTASTGAGTAPVARQNVVSPS